MSPANKPALAAGEPADPLVARDLARLVGGDPVGRQEARGVGDAFDLDDVDLELPAAVELGQAGDRNRVVAGQLMDLLPHLVDSVQCGQGLDLGHRCVPLGIRRDRAADAR